MKTSFSITGPKGSKVKVSQLEQGEIVQAGDWFLVLKQGTCDWHSAEPGAKIREFHLPHVRIIE